MFNPFYPLTIPLLESFVAKGKKYFVRQTFDRAFDHFDENIKEYFLFTHYDNPATAKDHYGAISRDRNRFLYEWNNPEDQEKLRKAASNLFKEYKVYAAVFKPDWERQLTNRLQQKTRVFIGQSLGWHPRADEIVKPEYELRFGELFLRFKYKSRSALVKFSDVENISLYDQLLKDQNKKG